MKTYRFYHRETGLFHHSRFRTTVEQPHHLKANTPADHVAIEGDFDALSQRVDVSKAQPQYDAHLAAHAERVGVARAGMREPPMMLPFIPTADVVVDYQPPQPSPDHEWNAQSKRWQMRQEVVERQAKRAVALAEIARLEASQHRPIREAALGLPGARERLQAIEAQIADLRASIASTMRAPQS